MIDVEQVLTNRFPALSAGQASLLRRPLTGMLRRLFHEGEVNRFLEERRGIAGLDFVDQVLEYFDLIQPNQSGSASCHGKVERC